MNKKKGNLIIFGSHWPRSTMHSRSTCPVSQFSGAAEQQRQSGRRRSPALHSVDCASFSGGHRRLPRFLPAGDVTVQERERSTSSPFN